jgi:MoaA/NifB/PqqE/SkfB family radical SAM enzyme
LNRVIAKLFLNGLRFRRLRCSGKPHRLESLSVELTHRCICRCRMCNIWQIPPTVPDLDLSTWLNLLSSPELQSLRELDLTGGEPFLRHDLDEILRGICEIKPACFPHLRTVSITTNGLLTDQILQVTRAVIGPLQAQGVDLVLVCGMDAASDLHDEIRQFPGAWARLQKTLSGLRQLRGDHGNLILGIKTTIVPLNAHELDRIADYAERHDLFTIISPCIITANRFGNDDRREDLDFSPDERQAMLRFFESPRFAWSGHRQALVRYLRTGKMAKPCSAGFNTLFIRHTGEVFACPVIAVSLGNIKERPLAELFRSVTADRFRLKVGAWPECQVCTEPGLERLAWPLEGFTLLRVLLKRGRADFSRLVGHMGLDKYR